MEATQPRHSTHLAQCANSSQVSNLTSSNTKNATLPSSDGLGVPPAPSKEHSITEPRTQPLKKKTATSTSESNYTSIKKLQELLTLLSLPLDVFVEIASHLHPLDLLHLSRTSRHFARIFLRMDNRYAWSTVRRTVENLPDCPSDLSEAWYAHLLFESICSGCGEIDGRLLFNLRVCFCESCYKAKIKTYRRGNVVDDHRDMLLKIVPHNYRVTHPRILEYFPDQFKAIMDEFLKVRLIGSGDDFLKERQEAVLTLINHGNLVNDFMEELQE